jgi:TIR domain
MMSEGITPQGQIPAYDDAVFISYSRADDQPPPDADKIQGWVTFFWQQLRWELNNAGVHQAELWLDRYEIDPTEDFTVKIDEALRKARLLIPIFSPNWVQRKYCQRELSRFVELRSQDDDADDNIVLVKKREVLSEDVPGVLQNREGYQFFLKEPSGKLREFYWRGLQDDKAYYDLVRQVADRIARRLMVKVKPTLHEPSVATNGRTIYLAAPADELRDCWLRLANDLRGSGYTVLPVDGRLSDTLPAAEAEISDALAKAELSVHLLGESEGGKPDGSEETLARLQLRLAREHAGREVGLPRVLWAPKWLPERQGGKRDPFEVVRRFGGLSPGEEVYGEEVTDLSQWLRGRLNLSAPASAGSVSTLLIAGAVPADDALVGMLANRLQSDEISVQPVFAGDALPADDGVRSAAALVPWGKADRASMDGLLDRLAPLRMPITVLSLPGDEETAKTRFFRQGVYIEPLEAVPADRRAARELLDRLLSEGS